MNKIILLCFGLTVLLISNVQCQFTKSVGKNIDNLNVFPLSDELALGRQTVNEIEKNPAKFPVLPMQGNEEVYRYVNGIRDKILNTGRVEHSKEFKWDIKIIKDDKTLNAFCTPGGYIYIYTGLIKYLDSEDQLAGVMGHEIAHAARRHSTKQLTKSYGLQVVTAVALGQASQSQVAQIAQGLAGLSFSRNDEKEADEYSVKYLCATDYNAAGCAGFFKKIGNSGSPPEFLSTHPNPNNRVQNIEQLARRCAGKATRVTEYQRIKSLLK